MPLLSFKKITFFTIIWFLSNDTYALEKNFFSIKNTKTTPISDNFFTPSGSIQFESSQYRELMFSSPDDKKFTIQASALVRDNKDIDKLRALFSYSGIVITGSSGSVKGSFKETGDSYFPDQTPSNRIFNTLLPSDANFNGSSEFLGVGKTWGNIVIGFGYKKTIAPQFLNVDTNQSYSQYTGRDRYLYRNSDSYYLEGPYPTSAIDGEGEIVLYGLWVRYDPLRKAFENAIKSQKSVIEFFYFYDLLIGNFKYTPGDNVSKDYAVATENTATENGYSGEGTTLKVNGVTSNFINMNLSYGAGLQAVFPFKNAIVGMSAGFESNYSSVDDFDIGTSSYFNSDYAEASLRGGTSSSSTSVFIRLAIAY